MAKSQDSPSYWAELLKLDLYKRNHGRLVRQLTAVAACILIFFGGYTLSKGPLSDYVNSYLAVTVRYSAASEDSAERDQKIIASASQHGGVLAEESRGSRFRELAFHFPTSSGWSPDADLLKQMRSGTEKFAAEINEQFAGSVRVSQPRGQTRRAVWISIGIPVLLCAVGVWMAFRAINYPRFADFLISVEAEMDKVSWPGKPELLRSTAVVVTTMFLLGFILLAYDLMWTRFFEFVGFLRISSGS